MSVPFAPVADGYVGAKLGAIPCGLVWTPVESKAFRSGLCGRLWTPVDVACRSTDQKVGDSSSPGRAEETPATTAGVSFSWGIGGDYGRGRSVHDLLDRARQPIGLT